MPCFQATWRTTPLEKFRYTKGPEGFNLLFKLRRVARWRGVPWEYFRELDTDDQAAYVAEYDVEHEFDYQAAIDRLRKQRRMSKRRP